MQQCIARMRDPKPSAPGERQSPQRSRWPGEWLASCAPESHRPELPQWDSVERLDGEKALAQSSLRGLQFLDCDQSWPRVPPLPLRVVQTSWAHLHHRDLGRIPPPKPPAGIRPAPPMSFAFVLLLNKGPTGGSVHGPGATGQLPPRTSDRDLREVGCGHQAWGDPSSTWHGGSVSGACPSPHEGIFLGRSLSLCQLQSHNRVPTCKGHQVGYALFPETVRQRFPAAPIPVSPG